MEKNQPEATRGGVVGEIIPEYLSIEVTTRCNNNRCNYCFALADLAGTGDLPFETALDIMEEGFFLGYRHLHLTGGEPTLWPNFREISERARDMGYRTVLINTNAMYLSEETVLWLAANREWIRLTVTLNGPEEIHDEMRGKGSYLMAKKGIRQLHARGVEMEIFCVVTRHLIPLLPGFAKALFAELPRIKSLTLIQLHRVSGDVHDLRDRIVSPDEFVTLVRTAGLLSLYGYPIRFLDNPLAGVVASRLQLSLKDSRPLVREGRLSVLVSGEITGAHSVRNAFVGYEKGRLTQVFSSEDYRAATKTDEETCPSCIFFMFCREGGMVRPTESHRDTGDGIPFCKQVNRLVSPD